MDLANGASRRWKLPAKYNGVVMPLILSLFMTCIVSAVATVINVGVTANLAKLWLLAWAWSWLIAFPTLLVVLPVVRRLVAAIVEQPGR